MMPNLPEVGAWHGEVLQKVYARATMDADRLLTNESQETWHRTLQDYNNMEPFVHLLLKDARALSV